MHPFFPTPQEKSYVEGVGWMLILYCVRRLKFQVALLFDKLGT